MADALDDDWWITTEGGSSAGEDQTNTSEDEVNVLRTGDKPSAKRRLQQKENIKKKRKTLSQELAEKTPEVALPKDLISKVHDYFKDKLTAVQFDEIHLEDQHFLPVHELQETSVQYLKKVIPDWPRLVNDCSQEDKGSPLVLILCGSAIRCVHLMRDISSFKGKKAKIVKLFAKHMKVKEQSNYLAKNTVHIGVGTPNRVKVLIESGFLKLSKLKFLILDWTWRDQKLKRLIDLSDSTLDLMSLLQEHLIPLMSSASVRAALL